MTFTVFRRMGTNFVGRERFYVKISHIGGDILCRFDITLCLNREELGISAALCHKRFVVALLDDPAVFQNDDL